MNKMKMDELNLERERLLLAQLIEDMETEEEEDDLSDHHYK
jgi:hypothetical protein